MRYWSPSLSLTCWAELDFSEGRVLCRGLSGGYSGHLAALLNFKSPSDYAHQLPTLWPLLLSRGWWGLISSECGLLWLHTKPHVDIPEDRALCKHTRPHQMARRGRTGLGRKDAEEDREGQEGTAGSEWKKSLWPPRCQATPAVQQCVTLPDGFRFCLLAILWAVSRHLPLTVNSVHTHTQVNKKSSSCIPQLLPHLPKVIQS